MKKPKRIKLAELRSGQKPLNNGQPPGWLIEAVGEGVAHAAILFDAPAIEMSEGVTIRLKEVAA